MTRCWLLLALNLSFQRSPGTDGRHVYNILDVYSKRSSLGKNVDIIGNGVFGTETGCCLAKDGL
jgi:hypothetical protein